MGELTQHALKIDDPGLRDFCVLLAKQTCKNTVDVRRMKPLVLETFAIKSNAQIVKVIDTEHKACVERVRSGVPLEAAFGAYKYLIFCNELMNHDIGARNKEELKQHI